MEKDKAFIYSYSAAANRELQTIRKKYLPKEENKLDELRRLDSKVNDAGMTPALVLGICGSLIFGLGLCMAMEVIGGGLIFGIMSGIAGAAVMITAYPVGSRIHNKVKAELTPRILQLTDELMSGTNEKLQN